MAKRYAVYYESDKFNRMSNIGKYNASTMRTAKGYINKIKNNHADENPRNFRIYDTFGEVEKDTNFIPLVFREM